MKYLRIFFLLMSIGLCDEQLNGQTISGQNINSYLYRSNPNVDARASILDAIAHAKAGTFIIRCNVVQHMEWYWYSKDIPARILGDFEMVIRPQLQNLTVNQEYKIRVEGTEYLLTWFFYRGTSHCLVTSSKWGGPYEDDENDYDIGW